MARKRSGEEEERAEVTFKVRHDGTVEQVLVAAALVDRAARSKLAKVLPHHDKFHSPQFAAAWAYVLELERRGVDHDPVLLSRMVGDKVDGVYLQKLLEAQPDAPSDLTPYVSALLWDHTRVMAAQGPASLFAEALVDHSQPQERVRAIVNQLHAMFQGGAGVGKYLVEGKALVRANMDDLAERIAGRASFPFGIETLDTYEEGYVDARGKPLGGTRRMLPGAMPGKITIIAGNTGAGKSTLAAHMSIGLARQGKKVLYCAWEPDEGMTLELMSAITLGWSLTALIQGKSQDSLKEAMRPDEVAKLEERQHAIGARVTFMRNPFWKGIKPSNDAHLDLLQEHAQTSGADVVFCDLWERLLVDKRPDQESAALFRQQSMAKELRAHFFLLAQNNKSGETGDRPTQKAITGSGAWVQIADNVLCPYRPALYKNVVDDTIEIHVLKQRHGVWPQVVELPWDPDKGAIYAGRTIPYEPPGSEREEGGWSGSIFGKKRKSKED